MPPLRHPGEQVWFSGAKLTGLARAIVIHTAVALVAIPLMRALLVLAEPDPDSLNKVKFASTPPGRRVHIVEQ